MAFTYNIPGEFIPGFNAIRKLSIDETERIADFLVKIPKGISGSSFRDTFLSLPIPEAANIAKTILSFGGLLTKHPIEEISERLVASYERAVHETLQEDEEAGLKLRLNIILSHSNSIKYTYKAIDLLGENEKVYVESRVLTDIRTIFETVDELNSSDAVIFHQLRIEYLKDGEQTRTFFAMDLSDLKELRATIDRAIDKHEAISEKYKAVTDFIEIKQ
jgi:DNA-binding Lrp family transcriptional regulator